MLIIILLVMDCLASSLGGNSLHKGWIDASGTLTASGWPLETPMLVAAHPGSSCYHHLSLAAAASPGQPPGGPFPLPLTALDCSSGKDECITGIDVDMCVLFLCCFAALCRITCTICCTVATPVSPAGMPRAVLISTRTG